MMTEPRPEEASRQRGGVWVHLTRLAAGLVAILLILPWIGLALEIDPFQDVGITIALSGSGVVLWVGLALVQRSREDDSGLRPTRAQVAARLRDEQAREEA